MRSIDTLVVGGGQAGLASSYHLRRRGVDHVVLEAGRIGESWRSRRWDSFTLVTPNWMISLPDLPAGVGGSGDPDGYLPRAEIVGMLAAWAAALAAPVHEGVTVTSVTRDAGGSGFVVETTDGASGDLHARLAGTDAIAAKFRRAVDAQVERAGLAVPGPEDSDDYPGDDGFRVPQLDQLDLGAAGITSVIWACGLEPDFSYLRLPVFDGDGWPIHGGGITSQPGLGFVGLRFQVSRRSDLFFGVVADAGRIVDRLLDARLEVRR